jgi:TonB family protein
VKRLATGGVLAVAALAGSLFASVPASNAQSCARPNVAAAMIRAADPEIPAELARQPLYGTVQVLVSLDPSSHVTGTIIRSSPNPALNAPALAAARASAFQTEIRDCAPIASYFLFDVTFAGTTIAAPIASPVFTPTPRPFVPEPVVQSSSDGRPVVVIVAQGVASRPPDVAYVTVGIVTNDDVAATAAGQNAAIYDALRAKLKPLGIEDAAIRNVYFNVGFVARPTAAPELRPGYNGRYGYVATRQLNLTVTNVAAAGAVVDAALAAGATSAGNVQYALLDRGPAYREALATALNDAASQARAVATASRMHVAGIKQIQVGQNQLGQPTAAPAPAFGSSNASAVSGWTSMHPAPVEVRASATVTYFLRS